MLLGDISELQIRADIDEQNAHKSSMGQMEGPTQKAKPRQTT